MILIPAPLSSVTRPVMQAALGVEDPCDGVGAKNGGFKTEEYDWNYTISAKLIYYAKNGGPAGPRDYDFKIEFEDGKPRVWVEDAEKYLGMDRADLCREIQGIVPDVKAYSNYLLTVKVKGEECSGLSGYGTAYIEHWQNMMNPLKNPLAISTYALACGTTTSVCYAAMTAGTGGIGGALSLGKWAKDVE
ncbi:hypothetical protein, partial [Thermococcus sp.]